MLNIILTKRLIGMLCLYWESANDILLIFSKKQNFQNLQLTCIYGKLQPIFCHSNFIVTYINHFDENSKKRNEITKRKTD